MYTPAKRPETMPGTERHLQKPQAWPKSRLCDTELLERMRLEELDVVSWLVDDEQAGLRGCDTGRLEAC